MKIVEKFEDLEKANAYISQINPALAAALEAKLLAEDKAKTLKVSLDQESAKVKSLVADLEKEKAVSAEAIVTIGDLSAQLQAQEEHGAEGIVVVIKKAKYLLVGDTFLYNGSSKTAKELSQDNAQLEKMLERKSGALVEIN